MRWHSTIGWDDLVDIDLFDYLDKCAWTYEARSWMQYRVGSKGAIKLSLKGNAQASRCRVRTRASNARRIKINGARRLDPSPHIGVVSRCASNEARRDKFLPWLCREGAKTT
jgi:hypothetical protein